MKIVPQSLSSAIQKIAGKNHCTILIGEDDIDDQEFLEEIFFSVDSSLELEFATSGSKVLDYLQQCKDDSLPSLILLDYNMPERNGAEILNDLKIIERYSSIPKIIWSTSRSQLYKDICLKLGANDYVIKPSNVNDFTKMARHILSFAK